MPADSQNRLRHLYQLDSTPHVPTSARELLILMYALIACSLLIYIVPGTSTHLHYSHGFILKIHSACCLSQLRRRLKTPYQTAQRSAYKLLWEIAVRFATVDTIISRPDAPSCADGPETTEIVIFAQCEPSTNTIRLHVGRVTQRPLQPQARPRAPRPDDPIPRKPPAFFIRDLKRTGSINDRDLKRIASSNNVGIGPLKRQKTVADLGSGVRLEDTIFKVPELPNQGKGKGKERDVFGDVSEVGRVTTTLKKVDDGLEKANKNVSDWNSHIMSPSPVFLGHQAFYH